MRGLVIGKFYPFHNGHKYLIEYASARVDELWILVCQKKSYQISAITRASWIQAEFPKARILVIPADHLSDDDSEGWATYTKQVLRFLPDFVFTSEDYGPPYAAFMGSTHVMVDRERKHVPISGTAVRPQILTHLDALPGVVRKHFVCRISIVGAESTGTTTLARELASQYNTNWVPEYGRMYWEGREKNTSPWVSSEFTHITQMQCAMEDQLAQSADKVLFCDTDAFTTSLWHSWYMGEDSHEVEALARSRSYDLYVLTDIKGVPFTQDGTRDSKRREWMHRRFVMKLREWNMPYVLASGPVDVRVAQISRLVDNIIASKSLAHP